MFLVIARSLTNYLRGIRIFINVFRLKPGGTFLKGSGNSNAPAHTQHVVLKVLISSHSRKPTITQQKRAQKPIFLVLCTSLILCHVFLLLLSLILLCRFYRHKYVSGCAAIHISTSDNPLNTSYEKLLKMAHQDNGPQLNHNQSINLPINLPRNLPIDLPMSIRPEIVANW